MSLNVVKIVKNKGTYRTTIKEGTGKDDYKLNEYRQYILPPDYYSAGYYERLTDGNYNDLPELPKPKVESLQNISTNIVSNLVESNNLNDTHLNILPHQLKKKVLNNKD